jgi:hypothetical protein
VSKPNPKSEKISVVAECVITSALGTETVRSFDLSWHRMREIGQTTTPVNCRLTGFVRKTDEEIKRDQ